MVSVLPVVPVRKYCAVYYLAHDSYHGMEEVVGSIPTRSTKTQIASRLAGKVVGSIPIRSTKTQIASRQAGKVVGSIPTRSTNPSPTS